MARGLHAADGGRRLTLAPAIEFAIFLASLKAIVADYHYAVRQVEFVGIAPAVAIDVVPVSRLELIKRVPEIGLVVRAHDPPLVAICPPGRSRMRQQGY